MEHEIDGMTVGWICGVCEAENEDLFNWTTFPMCENCSETFDWSEIIEQEEINELLAEMIPGR